MSGTDNGGSPENLPLASSPDDTAAGHWVLARLGKTVLRPGGIGLTRTLLAHADVANADVLELAPGLGRTATEIVARHSRSYLGAEKDPEAAESVRRLLGGRGDVRITDAAETGQPDASADVVIGEALLTAQIDPAKHAIVAEASRVLRPNGRYAIHEFAFTSDTVPDEVKTQVRQSLVRAVKHDILPLTVAEWSQLLADHGLIVDHVATAPSAMLEPGRLIADEGIFGALRFVRNVLTHRDARRRVLRMRRAFRNQPLVAVAIVAHKPGAD